MKIHPLNKSSLKGYIFSSASNRSAQTINSRRPSPNNYVVVLTPN